ncbi:hypothetical protein K402DRAFT_229592 [Aulographum hederae CBS 113979]|uniref:Uncharacterized protein n=1 Tax=Aulographum hederae CBS 113979 TaxID=1176131 RepID=A0A6G1HBN0_9PEZI|nr:hypothetical protein K402DRAFT_229592 [Aulographum hederae CBS 113979]
MPSSNLSLDGRGSVSCVSFCLLSFSLTHSPLSLHCSFGIPLCFQTASWAHLSGVLPLFPLSSLHPSVGNRSRIDNGTAIIHNLGSLGRRNIWSVFGALAWT